MLEEFGDREQADDADWVMGLRVYDDICVEKEVQKSDQSGHKGCCVDACEVELVKDVWVGSHGVHVSCGPRLEDSHSASEHGDSGVFWRFAEGPACS